MTNLMGTTVSVDVGYANLGDMAACWCACCEKQQSGNFFYIYADDADACVRLYIYIYMYILVYLSVYISM